MSIVTTRDFYLSAYLTAVGVPLVSHSKDGTITNFEFEDEPRFHEESKKYYSLNALVNPVAFGNSIRNLKSIIHMS
jgi:hypothetical protein